MFGSALGIMAGMTQANPKAREAMRGLGDRVAQGMRGPVAPAPAGTPPQGGGMPGGGVFSNMPTRRRRQPIFSSLFGGLR